MLKTPIFCMVFEGFAFTYNGANCQPIVSISLLMLLYNMIRNACDYVKMYLDMEDYTSVFFLSVIIGCKESNATLKFAHKLKP